MKLFITLIITAVASAAFGYVLGKLAQKYYSLNFFWPYPLLLCVTSVLFMFRFGLSKKFSVGVAFAVVCLFFSVSDILTRQVSDVMHLLVFAIGCFNLSKSTVLPMTAGVFVLGVPLLLSALIKKGSMGGADIKFAASAGWLFGWEKGLTVLILGLLLSVIGSVATGAIKHEKVKSAPMVPYLCAAGLIVYGIL